MLSIEHEGGNPNGVLQNRNINISDGRQDGEDISTAIPMFLLSSYTTDTVGMFYDQTRMVAFERKVPLSRFIDKMCTIFKSCI